MLCFVRLHFHAHFRICLSGYTHTDTHTQLGCCCCSVTQSCPTLCNPMDCSTPGFPILPCLLELAQTPVHWVGDTTQPSRPVIPFSSLQSFLVSGSFLMSPFFGQSIGASAWDVEWNFTKSVDLNNNSSNLLA